MVAGGDDSIPDARALEHVIARVSELGRGPPALVQWVLARLRREVRPRELANRLVQELGRTAPWIDTVRAANSGATRSAAGLPPSDDR